MTTKYDLPKMLSEGLIRPYDIATMPFSEIDLSKIPGVPESNILTPSRAYKPFRYPFGYDMFLIQNEVHWLWKEIAMHEDVREFNESSIEEKSLLTNVFRVFTQSDVEVNKGYSEKQAPIFSRPELSMAHGAIENIEGIHQAAYSYLLDTFGMPESEYSAFLEYPEMENKFKFLEQFNPNSIMGLLGTLLAYGGATEGVQLFASFAVLLNFPRHGRMRGMGQIVSWSCRDENLHVGYNATLFQVVMQEFAPIIDVEVVQEMANRIFTDVVINEDLFIDKMFEMGEVKGLTKQKVKDYVRYVANHRMAQFGFEGIYDIEVNPFPWVDEMMNAVEHANFFEQRATSYSRCSTRGTWEDAFDD